MSQKTHQLQANQHYWSPQPPTTHMRVHSHTLIIIKLCACGTGFGLSSVLHQLWDSASVFTALVGSSFVCSMESCTQAGVTTQHQINLFWELRPQYTGQFSFLSSQISLLCPRVTISGSRCKQGGPLWFLTPCLVGRRCLARIG